MSANLRNKLQAEKLAALRLRTRPQTTTGLRP
jgi:hypothetical protein